MVTDITEEFPVYIEGMVHSRNPENHNICEDVIGYYKFKYKDYNQSQAALRLLIETLQASLDSYEAAGIK
jgi:hypothetical protein